MKNTDCMTYDEYVDDIRKYHKKKVAHWEYKRKAMELMRIHDGDEFAEYDHEPEPRPSDFVIPEAPDIASVAPYSRVTLLTDAIAYSRPTYCSSFMIVFDVSLDKIEGYIDRKSWLPAGRTVINRNQIIECLPPLKIGEIDTIGRSDGIPF